MPFVPDAQPAASTGRFVPDAPAAPPDNSVGHNLLGEGELAGAGLVNLLPNAGNAAVDLYRRVSGGNTDAPAPFPTMKVGQAGQDFVRNVAGLTTPTGTTTLGQGVSQAAGAADAALGRVSPTLQDVVHQTGGVLSDVANLAPVAGAVAKLGGAAGDAISAAGAARDMVPGGPPNPINEVHAAGYKFRPSDVQARNPSMQSVPGSFRESITSSPEQTQQIVRDNAALSTRLIGEDIGVPDATKLTPQHYAQARLAPGADYDRVGAAVGKVENVAPATTETLDSMANDQSVNAMPAQARAQAARISAGLQSGTYAGPQIIQDISYFRTVPGGRAAAAALEDELGAQVASKAPELSGTYENARTTFAKIQNAEDATTGGLIDAADYRRLAEGNPRLLTGNSRLVAQAGGEIPTVTALPRAGADVSPVKGTLYDTVANAAARGAAKLPGLNITRPGLQAKIAAAAPDTGPLPTGPYPRGLPTVGQIPLPENGGANFSLAPPEGVTPPRPAARGPLGEQLSMQGPNADLTPPEGVVTPGRTPPRGALTLEESPGAYGYSPSDIAALRAATTPQLSMDLPQGKVPTPLPRQLEDQLKLRSGTAQQPGGGRTPTPPLPESTRPPEGQLPKRLGDYIRYLMEHGPAPRGSNAE